MIAYSMQKPKDWQDFERAMRVLIACVLADPTTQMHGRQGQAQNGVDVYARRAGGRWVGVQCKLRLDRPVTAEELREELDKARRFEPRIAEFVLATTAPRDADVQAEARLLTEAMRTAPRPIVVSVWGWEDIEEQVADHVAAQKAFDPTYSPYVEQMGERIDRRLDALQTVVAPTHHPADERLLATFRSLAPAGALEWLREHDFANPVDSVWLEPFMQIAAVWRGADYEFVDPEVQVVFAPVHAGANLLAGLVGAGLYPTNSPYVLTAKTDEDRRTGQRSQSTLDATKAMNAAATSLSKAIDDFLRVARARIVV